MLRLNSAVVNVVRVNQANAVKASACWVWRPTKHNGASITLKKHNYIDARGRSKSCDGLDFKDMMEVMLHLGGGATRMVRISGKGTLKTDSLDFKDVYFVTRTPQQNGVVERRNMTLIEAARTMLADSKLPTTFWAEAVSTACYVQNRVLVVKPHNKTPYELFRGLKPALNFMRPFRCHVTILNTLDNLGKFDGKSDEGFFVGYSLSSKAFRVYNTRTWKVEENLHIGFLENKPMIERNGPKWLFDIDSLTQSMNYVPVAAGIITNEYAGIQGELNAGTSTQKEEISKDCIVEDGPDNENDEKDKSEDGKSPKEVNADGQLVNTASPEVNSGHFKLNTVDSSVSAASSNDQDSPKDMFKMGASHTLEATYVEFFSDEDEPEIEPISIAKALSDSSWVEAMQEELLQFKLQQNEPLRLFFAYASFMGFLVYQMDVKSAFLYGTIEEEVYVTQPSRFKDPDHPDKVYNVVEALYGLHQAPRAWITIDLKKPLVKDEDVDDVDVHLYRSMIGSLIYLIASRPDIMFAANQHLGLGFLGISFELVAYTDSDYARATQDRKSTTGGCQFLGNRLISWQCKK
ncbi:retrovirus-related pol polyprotein from transposon TNT 1-94 [Tanacetum coccineum]